MDDRDERASDGSDYRLASGETTSHEYAPVRQVLQSEATGEEIRPDELFKGYEFAPNEFAAIDPQEIKAAEVETSDTIELFHFVKGRDVDPIYFERSYYVAADPGAEKVYGLLLEAMRREECFGIARIGMHRREHMLILRLRRTVWLRTPCSMPMKCDPHRIWRWKTSSAKKNCRWLLP